MRRTWLLPLGLLSVLGIVLGADGCLKRRDPDQAAPVSECTRCHGSPSREVTDTSLSDLDKEHLRAAPPNDLAGNTDTKYPGVGSHQIHLNAGPNHGPVACDTCHKVPATVDEPGHMDQPGPAKITFGAAASKAAHAPTFDPVGQTCGDTYCHRDSHPIWTLPREGDAVCGTCHALPPPAPHPQWTECFRCHGDVVDHDRKIIAPDKHVNGQIDVIKVTCHACHGSDGSNAPPNDLDGGTDTTSPGVGAHQLHLTGGQWSRPVKCEECHVVPAGVNDPGHFNDAGRAILTFSGVATTDGGAPVFDPATLKCSTSWCHGPVDLAQSLSPAWNGPQKQLQCDGCHGYPPAAPHPQSKHCSMCHDKSIGPDDKSVIDRSLHVNGVIDVDLPDKCNACHGNSSGDPNVLNNAAPPNDIAGNTDAGAPTVGAHQQHLNAKLTVPVTCDNCHVVPQKVDEPGHFDHLPPATLAFSGRALLWGAKPSYDPATNTCSDVYCHGARMPGGAPSGGQFSTPIWNAVDGGVDGGPQTACWGCHGLPPPAPHPNDGACSKCHGNIDQFLQFKNLSLHINGQVDL